MANPALTWKNVNSKDPSNLIRTGLAAGETLGDSFSSLGSRISDFADDKSKRETNEFVADIMAMDTNEEREQAIAAAENSFLDMGTIADKSYAFGADERALNTQIAAEGRLASAEDIINTRELGEAKNLLQASEKREDDLLEQSINYESDIFKRDNLYNAELLEDSKEYDKELLKTAKTYESEIFDRNNDRNDKVRMLEQKFITEERLYAEMITDERDLEAAAQAQLLANIEKDLEIELAKIEKDKEIEIKRIAENSKKSQLIIKDEIKKGTGLEKIMNRYSVNGQIVDTDMSSAASAAYSDAKQLMMDRGITAEQFDSFAGDSVSWNDRMLKGPNKFTFSYLGEQYHFGKKLLGNLFFNNIGGNDDTDMNALEAAINNDTIDKTNYNVGFNALTQLMLDNKETKVVDGKSVTTAKPIKLTKKAYQAKWENYLKFKTDSRGYEPTNLNEFLINIDKF